MAHVHSFAPIADKNAEVLVLGSMPGEASLLAGQYYAHPQNQFWRIMSELLQFDIASAYPRRVRALKSARIALWDVLGSCVRAGSLDAMMETDTEVSNNLQSFLRAHSGITRVFFNGRKAEACFKRHIVAKVDLGSITCMGLPSTSPANASMSYDGKLQAWRTVVEPALSHGGLPNILGGRDSEGVTCNGKIDSIFA